MHDTTDTRNNYFIQDSPYTPFLLDPIHLPFFYSDLHIKRREHSVEHIPVKNGDITFINGNYYKIIIDVEDSND